MKKNANIQKVKVTLRIAVFSSSNRFKWIMVDSAFVTFDNFEEFNRRVIEYLYEFRKRNYDFAKSTIKVEYKLDGYNHSSIL